jgi:hypothetical protein
MTGDSGAAITVDGVGRDLARGGETAPLRISIDDAGLTIAPSGGAPVVANFRDLTTLTVDQGRLLVVLGEGAARFVVEGLGDKLGLVVSELRERRSRQTLHDRFIEIADSERIEMVEYRVTDEHGVAQLAYDDWGVTLLPIDERRPTRRIRRADIAAVTADGAQGRVSVHERPRPGAAPSPPIELLGLGDSFERHRARLAALRDAALTDAAALVARLLPDTPFGVRQAASSALVDGRPVAASDLGDAWPFVERAVLVDPTFATSYRALVARGTVDDQPPPSWLALAPTTPTQTDAYKSWFLVGLPGNLVAFELVSAGAHATYLFRVVPRGDYGGQAPQAIAAPLTLAVFDISECLIDTRFLREPIYLTPDQLVDPRYTRYRFAMAALPTLQAARWRFVGRLIHTDDPTWAAALDDAISFNSSSKDDAQVWPGGAAAAATGEDGETQESS